jgi:hypothetical protein
MGEKYLLATPEAAIAKDYQVLQRFDGYLVAFEGNLAQVVLRDEQGREAEAELSAEWLQERGIAEQTWFTFEVRRRRGIVEAVIEPVQPQAVTSEQATQLWHQHREALADFDYRDDE